MDQLDIDISVAMQRGRADAESASECMAGLKTACADKLGTLEERIAGAVQAMSCNAGCRA